MDWCDRPSIRGTGNLAKQVRGERYSNPPSNPGLAGFEIDKATGRRNGFRHDGAVGTASTMARKGEPLR